MKKITLVVVLAMFSAVASAASFTTTIDRIGPYNSGVLDFAFANPPTSCTSTTTPKSFRVEVGQYSMTAEGAKEIYAALLYAAGSEKSVIVYFNEASAQCHITRVVVLN